jgi:hypothetical protein
MFCATYPRAIPVREYCLRLPVVSTPPHVDAQPRFDCSSYMKCLKPFASAPGNCASAPPDSAYTNVPTIACYSSPLPAGVVWGLPLSYMFTLGQPKYSDITVSHVIGRITNRTTTTPCSCISPTIYIFLFRISLAAANEPCVDMYNMSSTGRCLCARTPMIDTCHI